MIFSEKLIVLRKKSELSQEQLAEQLGVSRQAVSKWESGASIPDLDKIVKMSHLFNVSVDYLVKDEMEETENRPPMEESGSSGRVVSMEEADQYMTCTQKCSVRIALGVALCILSPILVILLGGASEYGIWNISENAAGGAGVSVLLAMVAVAVVLFITNGMALHKYEYMEKEPILTAYGVTGVVSKKKADYESTHRTHIAVGVALCILGVVPVFIAAALEISEFYVVCCVCVLLAAIAVGVFLMVKSGMVWGCYNALLQEGDYSLSQKKQNRKTEKFAPIYWCTVTAIFLAYSFITNDWARSWIIWPVAGVAFGAVCGIVRLLSRDNAE